jgi:hypothetical protein
MRDRANSDNVHRHLTTVNSTYDLPVGHRNRLLNDAPA